MAISKLQDKVGELMALNASKDVRIKEVEKEKARMERQLQRGIEGIESETSANNSSTMGHKRPSRGIVISSPLPKERTNAEDKSSAGEEEKTKNDIHIISSLRSQITHLTSQLRESQESNAHLTSSLKAREAELTRRVAIPTMDGSIEGGGGSTRLAQLEVANAQNKQIVAQLNDQVDFLNEQLAQREQQVTKLLLVQQEEGKTRSSGSNRSGEASMSQVKKEYQQKVYELSTSLAEKEEEIRELRLREEVHLEKLHQLNDKLAEITEEQSHISSEQEERQRQSLQNQEQERKAMDADVNHLHTKIEELKGQTRYLEEERSALLNALEEAREHIQSAKSLKETEEQQSSTGGEEEMIKQLQLKFSVQLSELRSALAEKEEEVQTLRTQLGRELQQSQPRKEASQFGQVEQRLQSLQSQDQEEDRRLMEAELNRLKAALEESKGQTRLFVKEREALVHALEEAQGQLQAKKVLHSFSETSEEERKEQNNNLQADLRLARSRLDALQVRMLLVYQIISFFIMVLFFVDRIDSF